MATDTTDQQITRPVDADIADNPVAFINMLADVEQRLVRNYASEADRTARRASVTENQLSTLADTDRVEVYTGTTDISLYRRSLYAMLYKSANQILTVSSTTLQNVTDLVIAVPAAGTFSFRGVIYYDGPTAADIKFAFNIPALATLRWMGLGVVTGGTTTGDATFTTVTASDATISFGAAGAGTVIGCIIEGEYVGGGTAGNLQFRAAQNTSDPGNTTINARSRLEVWRHA
jgi:hypothetical protein